MAQAYMPVPHLPSVSEPIPSLHHVRSLVRWPQKALQVKAKQVVFTDSCVGCEQILKGDLHEVVESLRSILDMNNRAAGVAAEQIGSDLAVFAVEKGIANSPDHVIFINPVLLWTSPTMEKAIEGCLSLPGVEVEVARPDAVEIKAFDLNGKPFSVGAAGFYARVIQHEYDHLQGITLYDKASFAQKQRIRRQLSAL